VDADGGVVGWCAGEMGTEPLHSAGAEKPLEASAISFLVWNYIA
jgi:hypothetical protein